MKEKRRAKKPESYWGIKSKAIFGYEDDVTIYDSRAEAMEDASEGDELLELVAVRRFKREATWKEIKN